MNTLPRKICFHFILFAVGVFSVVARRAQLDEMTLPLLSDGAERVCLSLRVLAERTITAIKENRSIPSECANLSGIGFLEGFVIPDEEEDIILIGQRSKTRPPLRLDDLIVNMRAISQTAYPYCSLDPRNEDTKKLQALFTETRRAESPSDMQSFFERVQETVGPQQVVIGGVPRESRHAHVMIDADYHMKKVSQGRIQLPNVSSYLDRSLDEAKKDIIKNRRVLGSSISMARFWFHLAADSPTFQKDEVTVLLENCDVVVLTEKQAANKSGERRDVGEDDPIAKAFAENLSQELPSLTLIVPIYAELENLFRLRALLLAMNESIHIPSGKFRFATYLKDYVYQDERPMPDSLDGLANSRQWKHSFMEGNIRYELALYPIICGGVGMDMKISEKNFIAPRQTRENTLRKKVMDKRPARNSLSWTLPAAL